MVGETQFEMCEKLIINWKKPKREKVHKSIEKVLGLLEQNDLAKLRTL